MKAFWIFRTIFIASSLAFGSFSVPSQSQTLNHTMTVTVPFGFELGSKHFAPGAYTVSTPVNNVIELQSTSTAGIIMTVPGQTLRPTKTSKIVFDRYGDHYFLRQIWFNAEETSYLQCPESKAEKEAKRGDLASNQKHASNVELAMLRLP